MASMTEPYRALLVALAVSLAGCGGDSAAPVTTAATGGATTSTTPEAVTTTSPPSGVIGYSIEGRAIEAMTLGTGPKLLYIVGSIHGDERPAVENVPGIVAHLEAATLDLWTVRIVLDANPDGSAANTRDNANGVDLNRNWPSAGFVAAAGTGPTPLSEPETMALAADIASFAPDLIVAFHAAREGPFIDYDGDAVPAANALATGASGFGREWQIVPEVDWPTIGSMGTYFGTEDRIPVLTVEANRWDTPAAVLPELIGGIDALLGVPGSLASTATHCDDHRIGATCSPATRAAHDLLHAGTNGGAHGFIIKEVGGRVHAAVNADAAFYPASTIKLVHLAHSLEWIGDGGDPATLLLEHDDGCSGTGPGHEEPLEALLVRMMQVSDNSAANAIQSHFGLEALAGTITDAGMSATRLVHGFGCGGPSNDPANRATSVDLARLLEGIADGSVISPAQWPLAESLLVDATAAAGFEADDGVRVLVKEGWYGTTLTIAGIAFVETATGVRTLVFAAYTDGADSVDGGFTIAAAAGTLIAGVIGP